MCLCLWPSELACSCLSLVMESAHGRLSSLVIRVFGGMLGTQEACMWMWPIG
uniref:Uncharacterized protein n=1 Tax=Rhizophora mucronata TaxID=61149 RepID=A0A2P2NMD4_RHIMU